MYSVVQHKSKMNLVSLHEPKMNSVPLHESKMNSVPLHESMMCNRAPQHEVKQNKVNNPIARVHTEVVSIQVEVVK